ncbi:MAG: glycosyltransferase [Planctomycetota bacterium]
MRETPDILFVQADQRSDHLPGVSAALSERGLRSLRRDEAFATPELPAGTRAVVVTDLAAPRCLHALRLAARAGARTALLLDGLTDFRNTFSNPRTSEHFLRPAPVDLVCCAGQSDAAALRALGNRAAATGLPRIDDTLPEPLTTADQGPILVATANTPAFDDAERDALIRALRDLARAADRKGIELAWRLTGGLDDDLDIRADGRSLRDAMARCSAVITTPSTLLLEAMRAGRPAALLHPYPTPLWHPAAWVWQPTPVAAQADTSGVPAPPAGLTRWIDAPERLLQQLRRPTAEQRTRQAECLAWLDASAGSAPAAELVAEALADLIAHPVGNEPRAIPRIERLPKPVPKTQGRTRVASICTFDDSPLGGATTVSQRLGAAFDADPSLGFEYRTLLVAWDAPNAHKAKRFLDERTSLCVVDRTEPMHRILEHVRKAAHRLEPDIVIPNHGDPACMVAGQLRHAGVRCVGFGLTDDDYYREQLLHTSWDGAVAGSEAIAAWLKPLAGDRPFATIQHGVPASPEPRDVTDHGPLELAYVGRVVEPQKRVMDLVPVARELSRLGVATRLHIVGEGAAMPQLREALSRADTPGVETVFHGWMSEGDVCAFYSGIDASVLMSDAEGTCMSMLGAMAFGVVPVMTRIESGAAAYVEDGVSGLLAGVGDTTTMARRLAWLAGDRQRIRDLGAEAHRRVAGERSIERFAAETADLLRAVMDRPIDRAADAAGLASLEPWRWADCAAPETDAEADWATRWLTEAGYRHVAIGAAEPGCDAVYVPTGAEPRAAGAGVTVVVSPQAACIDELIPHARWLVDRGCERIAVFGNGPHTHRRRGVFMDGSLPVVGLIDDRPPATGRSFGLPVVTPERAVSDLGVDGVVLSSDNWEARLFERTAAMREAGVVVRRIYTAAGSDEAVPARAGSGASASAS